MICPNCKAENKEDATHCSNCGEYIASTEPIENQASTTDKNSRLEEIQARRNKKKRQQKRNKVIVICLLAAIIIGLAVFGIYWAKTNFLDRTVSDDTIVVTGTPTVVVTPTPTEVATEVATELPTEAPSEAPTIAPTVAPTEAPAPTTAPADNTSKEQNKTNTTPSSGTATKKTTKKSGTTTKTQSSGKTGTATTAKSTTPSIPQGNPMTNQTVTGLGYVTVPSTGEPLICFSVGSTKYYAYVPSYNPLGTAKGTFKVDAVNTGAVYYGLPVYSLSNIQILNTASNGTSASAYILPKSSSKVLTEADLKGLTKTQLSLARNEIFARHGRTFKSKELQDYFNAQSWYKVNPNYNYKNDYLNLSSTEKTNAKFILAYENK